MMTTLPHVLNPKKLIYPISRRPSVYLETVQSWEIKLKPQLEADSRKLLQSYASWTILMRRLWWGMVHRKHRNALMHWCTVTWRRDWCVAAAMLLHYIPDISHQRNWFDSTLQIIIANKIIDTIETGKLFRQFKLRQNR